MRRAVITWVAIVAVVAGLGAGAVLALTATTFGAAAFVRVYLEAVGRGDAAGALSLAGVAVDPDARTDFLVDAALPGLVDLREVSTDVRGEVTEVTFSWRSEHGAGVSTFEVARAGTRVGIFPAWTFATSPVATLRLAVDHDERFDLNGIPAVSGVAADESVDYVVLVPGIYRADHHSTYLRADAVDLVADRPGSTLGATLSIEPRAAFTRAVTEQVHALLEACATQTVLFQTGCPLGHAIADRVVSDPAWSIVAYPDIHLAPAADFGVWLVTPSEATAHLTVEVQSLFDGSLSTYDEDLPISVTAGVTILADDATLRIEFVV